MPFSSTSDKLADFACVTCHIDAIRVVSSIDRYLYLRCDCCGEVSTMTERRGVWEHAQPNELTPPVPLEARLRRVTDLPAGSPR
jgi:hypothetical protein